MQPIIATMGKEAYGSVKQWIYELDNCQTGDVIYCTAVGGYYTGRGCNSMVLIYQ